MPSASAIAGVPWEDLSVLLAALRHGSVSRAAVVLRVGQSTASRRLARLEERLGARLFDRTPEGLVPTPFAHEVAPLAARIEQAMADLERVAQGQDPAPVGRVRLAVPDGVDSMWLVPELQRFFDDHPRVDLDLVVGQPLVDLVRREADLAIRFVRPTTPELVVRKLGHVPMAAYAHPDLASTDPARLRWLVLDDQRVPLLETAWVRAHIHPRHTMSCSLWHSVFEGVRAGLGAALLSPVVAEPAGLVRIARDHPPIDGRDLWLVVHEALRHVPRIAVLWAWLVDQAEQQLRQRRDSAPEASFNRR